MATIQLKLWNGGDGITAAQLNRIVEAIRRATPIPGNGIMVSQGAGGSVISLAPGGGANGAGGGMASTYPFRLATLKTASHDYVTFEYSEGAVSAGGEKAACIGNYSPTTPDGSLRLVSDGYSRTQQGVGSVTNLELDDLDNGESVDIYAVAARMGSGFLYYLLLPSAIYTTTAPDGPDLTALPSDDAVVQSVLVGTVKRVGTSSIDGTAVYDVTNQAVRSAITLGNEDGVHPYKLKVDDDGRLLIYLPGLCCQVSQREVATMTGLLVDTDRNPRQGNDNWYEVEKRTADLGSTQSVYIVANTETGRFYASMKTATQDATARLHGFVFVAGLAYVNTSTNKATGVSRQDVVSQVILTYGESGDGGGTTVVVQDAPTGPAENIAVATSYDGVVTITNYPGLSDVKVVVGEGSLQDYLMGGADDYGTNINTANFEDECLGDEDTPDEAPDPNLAAPSFHKHSISQLTDDLGEALGPTGMIDFLEEIGMWDDLGGTGQDAPSDYSFLTVSDVEDDATRFRPDSATPSAGEPGDLLALSGHQHPLNLVETAELPTGSPAPDPNDYVVPVGYGIGPSGEDSPTTPMFGVAEFYARVDHIHPICAEMGPSGGIDDSMGDLDGDFGSATGATAPPGGVTLDSTKWEPGKDGYTESYCSRVAKITNQYGITYRYAIFRKRKVSRTGAVIWRGPEYLGFAM